MKKETDTRCINCKGTVVRDDRISRIEKSLGHRKYTCVDCLQSWKWSKDYENYITEG